MVALTRFVLEQTQDRNNSFIASTVVSTPLMSKLAAAYGVECKLGLTGFMDWENDSRFPQRKVFMRRRRKLWFSLRQKRTG